MSSNISFHEGTERLKIDITISCLSSVVEIFVRILFIFVCLYIFCVGLVGLFSGFGGSIIGILFIYISIGFTINLISDIAFIVLRRTRESIEIDRQTFKLSWSEQKNNKIADLQLHDKIKYIKKVSFNTDTIKSRGSTYSPPSTYHVHSCLMMIYGRKYKFGKSCRLSSRDAYLIAEKINLFLRKNK